jgi:hypothetical protein
MFWNQGTSHCDLKMHHERLIAIFQAKRHKTSQDYQGHGGKT